MDSSRQKWGTLISCSLSSFIGFVDFAIVNTALPAIQESLSASLLQLQWIINGFVLMMCVLTASTGRIADLFGRKKVNGAGVALFGISSLLAGFAWTPEILILCRFVQGIGIALIIPSSIALISHAFPKDENKKAIGIWSGITGLGLAFGPVLGGILVSALNWRWIFYINVPFAAASLILNAILVKESKDAHSEKKIDPKGFALLTVGIMSLVTALMHTPDWGWSSWRTLGLFILSIAAFIFFYRSESKCSYPIIPFAAFANRGFFISTAVVTTLIFIVISSFFLMPLYLQTVRHEEPYVAGLMLLPITGILTILAPFVGHWKISEQKLMAAGLVLFFASTATQGFFKTDSSPLFVIGSFSLMGLAWALSRGPATTLAMASLPPHLAGSAAGVLWTVQNIGGSVGLALTGTLFRVLYQGDDATFMSGYHAAMWLQAALALAVLILISWKRARPLRS